MNFDTHYVAFIDILGFSEMVKHDSESPDEQSKYFQKLFEVFKNTKEIITGDDFDIVQFSDSIIISAKYDKEVFRKLIDLIAGYQMQLFQIGILIRGGITLGKHFHQEGFIFSQGLINSYFLENKIAKYPRIIISADILSLIYPENNIEIQAPLLKENDKIYFIDYLKSVSKQNAELWYHQLLENNGTNSSSVLEKYNWIKDYIKFKFPDSDLQNSRFYNL